MKIHYVVGIFAMKIYQFFYRYVHHHLKVLHIVYLAYYLPSFENHHLFFLCHANTLLYKPLLQGFHFLELFFLPTFLINNPQQKDADLIFVHLYWHISLLT